MANAQLGTILRHVRRLLGAPVATDCTDGQLLERFVAWNDENAFTELVRRLGPMVLGVCRRVLSNPADVEDVFQAAFMMLAAKGASIRKREAVGGWLYEVAHHLALKSKANAARRRLHERLAADMLDTDSGPDHDWQELRVVFDEELQRLPEKYRTPLVLCYLEGKTNEQAAQELGCPVGSMSRHLARGKELLRERVANRGVLLSTGLLFTLFVENAPGAVPARLVTSTVKAATLFAAGNSAAAGLISAQAAALARGMIQAMFLTRLKFAAVLALGVSVLGIGGSLMLHQAVKAQATAAVIDDGAFLEAIADQPAAEQPAGKDNHGDPLPPGALRRLGTLRFRHAGPITYVAFPADGKSVITASQDGTIRLWDLDSGKEIRRFGKQQAAAAGPQGAAEVQLQALVAAQRQLRGGFVGTGSVTLSPDGKTLAIPSGNVIQLVDVSTGKDLQQIKPTQGVGSLVFSPDGKLLATRGNDRTIYLWETDTGKEARQIKAKQPAAQPGVRIALGNFYGSTAGLVFSPDGKVLAMTDTSFENQKFTASVKLVDVETGKDLREIKIEQNGVSGLAFSPDGKMLAYGSGEAIHLCQPDSGKEIRQIGDQTGGITALVFSPDGKLLATKGGRDSTVRLNDVEAGKVVHKFGGQPAAGGPNVFVGGFGGGGGGRDLAFSRDGKLVGTGGGGNTLQLWVAATGKEAAHAGGHRGPVSALVIAADGKTIISKGADNTIRRWDAATGKELNHFAVPAGSTCLAIAPDAATVALGNTDNTVRIIETSTGKELHQLKGHSNGIALVAYSPDSKTVASRGSSDNTIRLYDVTKGSEVKTITIAAEAAPQGNPGGALVRVGGFFNGSLGLVFSPDGKYVASAGTGGGNAGMWQINGAGQGGGPRSTINLWDVATGKVARKIVLPQQRGAVSMAFAPDGRVLATENSDQTVTLWEVASGKERGQLGKPGAPAGQPGVMVNVMIVGGGFSTGGVQAATTLAFSADGRTLVARGANQSVRVWDVAAAKEVRELKGHQGRIAALAYAADGKTVATGSDDTTILIWDVSNLSLSPKPPVVELSATDAQALWGDLASEDGVKAVQGIRKLTTAPRQAVSLLQEQVKAAPPVDAGKIQQWITNLESEKFTERKQALDKLEKLGALAVPALQKVLTGQPALETRKRVEQLLDRLTGGGLTTDQVRVVRAVEVLEELNSAEARQHLETLAKGAAGAVPTRKAQAALARLAKRSTAK